MDLRDTTIAVTGGANGIGRALVQRFAAEGARSVAVLDLDAAAAEDVAGQLSAQGTAAMGVGVDVAGEAALEAAIDRIEDSLGPLDLFCSNAGIIDLGGPELPTDEWLRMLNVNVLAHVHAARILVPRMIGRGGGYLLNTASAAGLLTQLGSAPYSVTKAAAVSLAEWLAITYGGRGLKVSVLCPQAVNTAMTAGIEGGGVAGVDGMLEPDAVADAVVAGLAAESFLILPHAEVAEYVRRKADDRDRWIGGMRRLQDQFLGEWP